MFRPDLYLGTGVARPRMLEPPLGFVRGVTPSAALLRWRSADQSKAIGRDRARLMVGRLAATKLGARSAIRSPSGGRLRFEGRDWTVSGSFAAAGILRWNPNCGVRSTTCSER